jgi:histidyl-tRNA synthetase
MGMRVVLVLGPDEAANGNITVKNLSSGTQEVLKRTAVLEAVKRILEKS